MDTNNKNLGKKTKGITKAASKLSAACLCFLQICAVIAVTVIFGGHVAFAVLTAPDLLELKEATVYHSLIEEDDFLLLIHYNIHWNSTENQPDDPASKTFLIRLMSTDESSELGVVSPYPFYNSGYDEGAAAIYFDAATAPTWGDSYIIRLEGNPTKWETVPLQKYTLAAGDYSSLETQEANQDLLGSSIINLATDLEVNWDAAGILITATDVGMVLTVTGETYFLGAIPGLRSLAPSIFSLQTEPVDWDYQSHDTSKANEYEHQYDDTPIGDAIDALGELFGNVSPRLITSIFMIGIYIAIMGVSSIKYQTATPGLLAGVVILAGAAKMGLFSFALLGVMALVAILFIGYIFHFKGASG